MPTPDEEIARHIAEHGGQEMNVADHRPPFLYTCGLMTTGNHPEFNIIGVQPKNANAVLQLMVEDIKNGKQYVKPGLYSDVLRDSPIAIRNVDPTQHEMYLGYAMGHCRD